MADVGEQTSRSEPLLPAATALATAAIERMVVSHTPEVEPEVLAATDDELAGAITAFEASLAEPSTVGRLVRSARLSLVEAAVLVAAIVVEHDARLQLLLAHVHGQPERSHIEVGTLRTLFGTDARAAAGPGSGLARAALVELRPAAHWSRQAITPTHRVAWLIAGDPSPDPDLPDGYVSWPVEGCGSLRRLVVTGPDRVRRRDAAVAEVEASSFLVGPAPTTEAGWSALVREATLADAGVVVELDGPLPTEGRRWIDRAAHLAFVLSTPRTLPVSALPSGSWQEVVTAATPPTDDEWQRLLGTGERRHLLTPHQLEQVATLLPMVGGDVDAAVRRLVSSRLDELARRIRPSRSWNDLVLPAGHLRQLRELVERYHLADKVYGEWGFPAVPSRGLVALFSGPSGTGKTLAAEVMAGELGLDLFKLNLSSVVSKYIGETEKNLDELFEAAGAGNLVLFFDEADALFGRRSEVKDSHDKYANMETSYLLQRLETYDGVVVMATNFEKNIDDAFLRRIHTRVDFALPTEHERSVIWKVHLEHGAPLEGVDFPALGKRFELSGGSIRNAAVHAAFLAAAEDAPITTERIVRGIAREFRKLGRLLRRDDFGDLFPVVNDELTLR